MMSRAVVLGDLLAGDAWTARQLSERFKVALHEVDAQMAAQVEAGEVISITSGAMTVYVTGHLSIAETGNETETETERKKP